jgi:hypothetical protein
VFFGWKYHTSGFITRTHEPVGFPAKKTTLVIFPLKKHTGAIFCLSHDTKWKHFEAFLAWIVANLNKKFKTQSSAVTSQMTWWWRYADGSNNCDVTPTGAMTSLGPVVRCSTICMTSLRLTTSITMQPCDTTIWSGKISHSWIARLAMATFF